jgi:hypothetical protein
MATNSETATVEVLTAEVRVLQVGRRQITMSVCRQLDQVEPWQIEPFGRVSDGEYGGSWVAVVGRDTRTGALVRALACWGSSRPAEDRAAREWRALPLIVLAGLR